MLNRQLSLSLELLEGLGEQLHWLWGRLVVRYVAHNKVLFFNMGDIRVRLGMILFACNYAGEGETTHICISLNPAKAGLTMGVFAVDTEWEGNVVELLILVLKRGFVSASFWLFGTSTRYSMPYPKDLWLIGQGKSIRHSTTNEAISGWKFWAVT